MIQLTRKEDNMKGKCEIFNRKACLGCIALAQDNIDELKLMCEIYREEMKLEKGEQEKLWQ